MMYITHMLERVSSAKTGQIPVDIAEVGYFEIEKRQDLTALLIKLGTRRRRMPGECFGLDPIHHKGFGRPSFFWYEDILAGGQGVDDAVIHKRKQ